VSVICLFPLSDIIDISHVWGDWWRLPHLWA
jgi:hypothetical protein